MAAARSDGPPALAAHPSGGRPAKFRPEPLRRIPDLRSHGAEAYGLRGQVRIGERAIDVMREEFSVNQHPGRVSRLLKALGWTPQFPPTRAVQRGEAEVQG